MKRFPVGLVACGVALAVYAAAVVAVAVAAYHPPLRVAAREVFATHRIVPPLSINGSQAPLTGPFTFGHTPTPAQVIRTQAELDAFVVSTSASGAGWENPTEFANSLRTTEVNFDAEVVVLVRQHASSVDRVQFEPIRFRGRTMVCHVTSEQGHFMGSIRFQSVTHCRAFVVSRGVEAVEVHVTEDGVAHPPVRVATR